MTDAQQLTGELRALIAWALENAAYDGAGNRRRCLAHIPFDARSKIPDQGNVRDRIHTDLRWLFDARTHHPEWLRGWRRAAEEGSAILRLETFRQWQAAYYRPIDLFGLGKAGNVDAVEVVPIGLSGDPASHGHAAQTLDAALQIAINSDDPRPVRWSIIGDSGSGKSTVARDLLGRWLPRADMLPVYVPLMSFTEPTTLFQQIESIYVRLQTHHPPADGDLAHAIHLRERAGRLLVLFDEFDEISDHRDAAGISPQERALTWIDGLSEIGHICVFTRASHASLAKRGFDAMAMGPLDEEAQRILLESRLKAFDAQALFDRLHAEPAQRVLMRSPLLLTAIAILERGRLASGRAPSTLPTSRVQWLGAVLDSFFKRLSTADKKRVVDTSREMLAQVCLSLEHPQWTPAEFDHAVETVLESNPKLHAAWRQSWEGPGEFRLTLQTAGLVRRAASEDQFAVLHRALHDRLAAQALAALPQAQFDEHVGRLQSGGRQGSIELLAMAGSLAGSPERILDALAESDSAMVLRVLAEMESVPFESIFKAIRTKNDWDGDRLLELVERHRVADETLQSLLEDRAHRLCMRLQQMRRAPDDGIDACKAALDGLAYMHYVLDQRGLRPDREAFFGWLGGPPDLPRTPVHQVGPPGSSMGTLPVWGEIYSAFDPWARASRLRPLHPATGMSWWRAYLFARWCRGALPDEDVWYQACIAAGPGPDPVPVPVLEPGWIAHNAGFRTHPVIGQDTRPAPGGSDNRIGLRDMLGNVFEWCANPCTLRVTDDQDPRRPPVPSRSADIGDHRVIRGGAYWVRRGDAQPTSRSARAPRQGYADVGFRVWFDGSIRP